MKYLEVTFSDGQAWRIPLRTIAAHRAKYYASRPDEPTDAFDIEFRYAMENGYEAIDWAQNNMDWADIEQFAVQVKDSSSLDKDEEWSNSEMAIIDG